MDLKPTTLAPRVPLNFEPSATPRQDNFLTEDHEQEWGRAPKHVHPEKRWWRRPHPYLLLVISSGQALSIGLVIAAKTDLSNQLVCLAHLPPASELHHTQPSTPASSFRDFEARTAPSSLRDAFSPYLDSRASDSLEPASPESETIEIGGRLLDKVKCRQDPKVQASLGVFAMIGSILSGSLASLTTGWWGKMSDRVGRTKVMVVAMGGIVFADMVFLAVARWPQVFSYFWIILGLVVDGFLGGSPTLGAVNMSYLADSSPDGSRAALFSLFMGLMMAGIGLGPLLGTWFIDLNHNNLLSVFYLATALHLTMLVLVTLLPESLSLEARQALIHGQDRVAAEDSVRDDAERAWERRDDSSRRPGHPSSTRNGTGLAGVAKKLTSRQTWGGLKRLGRRSVAFLSPLLIFLPSRIETTGAKNWNLSYVGMGQGMILTMMGSFVFAFQYIQLQFGWGYEKMGPLLSLSGGIRAIYLLFVLPAIIRTFKPRSLNSPSASTDPSDSKFDLLIVKASLMIDIVSFFGILASQSPTQYVVASTLATLGGGAGPAISSISLELAGSTNAGKLFSGMAVLQSIASVVGLAAYGLLFTTTASFFPKAIFCLSLCVITTALFAFWRIRLDAPSSTRRGGEGEGGGGGEEDFLLREE